MRGAEDVNRYKMNETAFSLFRSQCMSAQSRVKQWTKGTRPLTVQSRVNRIVTDDVRTQHKPLSLHPSSIAQRETRTTPSIFTFPCHLRSKSILCGHNFTVRYGSFRSTISDVLQRGTIERACSTERDDEQCGVEWSRRASLCV